MAKKQLAPDAGRRMADYIRSHLGQELSYTTIDGLCGTTSSNLQYNLIVGPLIKDGVLKVSKRQVMRGNGQAPIHKSYRICAKLPADLMYSAAFMCGGANMGVMQKELADLNPVLTENGFLYKNLPAAEAWHDELVALGNWLAAHEGPLDQAIMEERSFEIFHNEKLLGSKDDRRGGRSLIELVNNIGVMPRLYLQSEVRQELVYYVPPTLRKNLTVLIVENHAPFVHVQEALARGVRTFFGRHVDGVVYGRGYGVLAGDALRTTEALFSHGNVVRYLYWGDIDRQGIGVYERLAMEYDVEPLVAAYQAMISHAGDELPASPDPNFALPPHMGIAVASKLDVGQLEYFMRVLAGGLRVPQEAIPPSVYDGMGATPRLTLTLRSRVRKR